MPSIQPSDFSERGDISPLQHLAINKTQSASQIVASEKDLINFHLQKYSFLRVRIFGKILKAIFGNRIAKNTYIKELEKQISSQTQPKTMERIFQKLRPHLKHLSMKNLQKIELFLNLRGGPLFLKTNEIAKKLHHIIHLSGEDGKIESSSTKQNLLFIQDLPIDLNEKSEILNLLIDPSYQNYLNLLIQDYTDHLSDTEANLLNPDYDQLLKSIRDLIEATKRHPEGIKKALDIGEAHIFPMMGNRFDREEKLTYYQSWIEIAKKAEKDEFHKGLKTFTDFYQQLEEIQAQRPTIPETLDQKLDTSYRKIKSWFANYHQNYLKDVSTELLLATVNINTQIIHQNLAGFFLKTGNDGRMRVRPNLEHRLTSSFSLSNQTYTDVSILEDGEEMVNLFDLRMRLMVTNEKTMETRAMRLPIPIGGALTKTNARKLFQLLEETACSPKGFDKKYEELSLPQEQKEEIKTAFIQWEKEAVKTFNQVTADFNQTKMRDAFTFLREEPQVVAALNHPEETTLLLEVIKGQNLSQLPNGHLSLLPPEIRHPKIGEIAIDDLKQGQENLRNQSGKQSTIDLPQGEGSITFAIQEDIINSENCLWINITISQNENNYTHKTLLYKENRSDETCIEDFIQSNHFERECLLAKAEFIENLERLTFEPLKTHVLPYLTKFSYSDQALVLNFMTSLQGKAFTAHLLKQEGGQQGLWTHNLLSSLKKHPEFFAAIPLNHTPKHLAKLLENILNENDFKRRNGLLKFLGHPKNRPYLKVVFDQRIELTFNNE
ncbi:MAG: hypothetical protein R3E91_00920 [Chlamydiales bacterium]